VSWLIQAICVLLVLPFLTVTAGTDRFPVEPIASLESSYAITDTRSGSSLAKLAFPQSKRSTAELEDGPEGEEAPSFSLDRGSVGDDLAATPDYERIAFASSHAQPVADRIAPPRSFAVFDGFPTGPPAA
jgi:hypothetical protein